MPIVGRQLLIYTIFEQGFYNPWFEYDLIENDLIEYVNPWTDNSHTNKLFMFISLL